MNLGPMNLSPKTAMLLFQFVKNRDNMNTFSEAFIISKRTETKKIKKEAMWKSGAGGRVVWAQAPREHTIRTCHLVDGWTRD